MRRFCLLALLTLLSSSAQAGSFSFSVGGHRIHIESPRYCRSSSCASVSISGISQSRRKRDDGDRDNGEPVKPAAAPVAVPTPAVIQPMITPSVAPAPPPPAVYKPAAAVTQTVPAPPIQPAVVAPPAPPAMRPAIVAPPAPPPPPVEKPIEAVRPAPPSPMARVSHEVDDEPADTPRGDWQTEGKGEVRITRCGRALCGYVINASSKDRGEAVLVNMKPKSDTQWTGHVYSHDSGDTYHGTMKMKGVNTLRVEACALGRFYCSGNNWTRIGGRAERLMTSQQTATAPRS
jgi:Uncharacterized protein conserved in bacteria (DUF2147)